MDIRPSIVLQLVEYIPQVFYEQNTFIWPSKERRLTQVFYGNSPFNASTMNGKPTMGLLCVVDLQQVFCEYNTFRWSSINEIHPQFLYEQKSFHRSSMYRIPFIGLPQVIFGKMAVHFYWSSMNRRFSRAADLKKKNFYEQKTIYRSFINRVPPMQVFYLQNTFYEQKTFHRSSKDRKPSTGLLWIEYILQFFQRSTVDIRISSTQVSIDRILSMTRRPFTGLPRTEYLPQVFMYKRPQLVFYGHNV